MLGILLSIDLKELFHSLQLQHLLLISAVFWFIWYRIIFYKGYLIDDLEGIARYSEVYDAGQDKVVNAYDLEYTQKGEKKKKSVRYLNYIQELGFPGALLRFIRLHFGKKFKELGKNKKGHPVYGYVQDPARHHVLSLLSHQINLILAYFFISKLFGNQIAFLACLLFSVNPISCQTVAWISGINYLWSFMGALAVFNSALYAPSFFWSIPLIVFFSAVSTFTLLTGGFTWICLLILGRYWEALASFTVSALILWKQGREIVAYRQASFKEQNMGRCTVFNFKKPIVMVKTLFYYLKMILMPMRLGLFASWGYHYDEIIERPDKMFWGGFLSILILGLTAVQSPLIIRFSIVWFVAYLIPFLNVITAQQFVVDRYAFIPVFGVCLAVSYLLQDYPQIYYVLLGLYAMRTIIHIPTFKNDENFYLSNYLNFPDSEVALGNLGVTYMNVGKHGSAVDTWFTATKINNLYDVPWYNLYSIFRGNGFLDQAKDYLNRCLNSRTIHFKDQWVKEMEILDREIRAKKGLRDELNITANYIGRMKK